MKNTTSQKPKYKRIADKDFNRLRKEVLQTVKELEKSKKWQITAKVCLFPLFYASTYLFLLHKGENPYIFFGSYFLLGILLVSNFLNLIHDAVHGAIFRSNTKLNELYVHFFDLLGANSYIWRLRHIRLHHAYPNVMDWDSDLEQSPLARIFPQGKYRFVHKYQHIYLPFLYPLYLFNWLLVRDFRDFFRKNSIVKKVTEIPPGEYGKLFLFKAIFIGYLIVIPKYYLDLDWFTVLKGFVLLVFTASLFSLLVLLSPHANANSQFYEADSGGQLKYPWFEHQLRCTNDVSGNNLFTSFFMGNFNYHIAHHLFPDIHHIYYPEITRLIQEFAWENGMPYRRESLIGSLVSHYKLLKLNARRENIFEETM